mmetsp:Transcript_13798/g.33702  ORF Transcript_13798/g.33702 Transcript_13798/m.33702 type:complete len:165 (-) Transcript_13798:174-668(-)|eukprot:CAMPEP_0114488790 /NCGR_PEP_ID=MMETSP0109-20121206/1522_1 /TAXON_ID=29199 /ORGANISM="Chlorarachnion reptans, Strain CCCM449" /LENGTH=164 /DNA_ID=CAMNT_0001665215 /DNA_START=19 /DNA_END=513 /DNA_ORIENTATION=+
MSVANFVADFVQNTLHLDPLNVGRGLVGVTFIVAGRSTLKTFQHSRDITFEAPKYRGGKHRQHTRYHAFRGATLALAASTVQVFAMWMSPERDLNPTVYYSQWILALGHYGGWYIPYLFPKGFWVQGAKELRAPVWAAEYGHIVALATNVLALLVARPKYFLKN